MLCYQALDLVPPGQQVPTINAQLRRQMLRWDTLSDPAQDLHNG
jgi:hypothetical protein